MKNNKDIKWINCAKCVAIFAVLFDHTKNVLYHNPNVQMVSFYSVSLFVLISGMTSYISNENHKDDTFLQSTIRRCKKIVVAYIISVAVILCFVYKFFDFYTWKKHVLAFDIVTPHYFVLLYLQLMLVSKILYNALNLKKNNGLLYELFIFCIVLILAYFSSTYSNINNIYGGGGRLLGGSYLILFYIGMLIMKHSLLDERLCKKLVMLVTGIIGWMIWIKVIIKYRVQIDSLIKIGEINPPGISLMIFGFITLLWCYGLFGILCEIKYTKKICDVISLIGKHSLYIFLYHITILNYIEKKQYSFGNIYIKRVLVVILMIIIPIILEYIINYVINYIYKLAKYKIDDSNSSSV